MKKLLILSGKGGTGKTTTAAAFVQLSGCQAFADCDVDAPNLHLVAQLDGTPTKSPFLGGQKASIDQNLCTGCEKCVENCNFSAIKALDGVVQIDPYSCEGCAVCTLVCPHNAVTLADDVAGECALYHGETTFSTAKLKMGRGNSGKLVSEVKTALSRAATADFAVIDGSPGIGCPVIASMSGVDLVLIVAEPSLSGISDMSRILETARIFEVKTAVCINKYDVNLACTAKIEAYCHQNAIALVGKIPFDRMASTCINEGKSLVQTDCPASTALKAVYEGTIALLTDQMNP